MNECIKSLTDRKNLSNMSFWIIRVGIANDRSVLFYELTFLYTSSAFPLPLPYFDYLRLGGVTI